MRIVVADDDPLTRAILARTLTKHTSHKVTTVADGDLALDLALSDDPPDALLLDWVMPRMTGTEVCRRVRAAPLRRQPYILLVTVKNQRDELVEGLGVGADDLLSKPIAPEVLIARLRSAELQRGSRRTSALVQRALMSARSEGSGELLIRDGEVTGHVFFHQGAVAWAHISDDRNALFELLSPESGLDKEAARDIVKQCRETGARLSDVLVSWGLTDRASLRDSMQNWIMKKLETISGFRQPQTLFVPHARHYADDMLFDLEEVAPSVVSESRPGTELELTSDWCSAFPQADPDEETTTLLARCMGCEGISGVAILDRELGCCFGQSGSTLNPHIAWAMLQSMSVVSRHAELADIVVVTPPDFHLIRVLKGKPNRFVYARASGDQVLLGAARLQLQQVMDGC